MAGTAHGARAGRYRGAWQQLPCHMCACWGGLRCATKGVAGGSCRLARERLRWDTSRCSAERAARALRAYADDTEHSSSNGFRSRNALAAACLERGRLRRAEALACRTFQRPAFANARERFGDAATVAAALIGRVAFIRRDRAAAEAWSRRALQRGEVESARAMLRDALDHAIRAELVAAAFRLDSVVGNVVESIDDGISGVVGVASEVASAE